MPVPSRKPKKMAGSARRRVPPAKEPKPIKPWTIRKEKLSATTRKSMLKLAALAARDHARDRHSPLHARHDRGDGKAERQVDQRSGRQRLEGFGGVCFDLSSLKGQLRHPNGQCDGGV